MYASKTVRTLRTVIIEVISISAVFEFREEDSMRRNSATVHYPTVLFNKSKHHHESKRTRGKPHERMNESVILMLPKSWNTRNVKGDWRNINEAINCHNYPITPLHSIFKSYTYL